jgi:hypothetical protein
LEPLADLLLFEAADAGTAIRFVPRGRRPRRSLVPADFVEDRDQPLIAIRRAQETELPSEVALSFFDALADYRASNVSSRRLATGSRRTGMTDTAAVMSFAVAGGLADTRLQDIWAGREGFVFGLSLRGLEVEPGDVVALELPSGERTMLVRRIEDAGHRRIEARSIEPAILSPVPASARALPPVTAPQISAPEVLILDLPILAGDDAATAHAPRVAAFASPWPGAVSIAIGTPETGFVARQLLERPAVVGELLTDLAAGPVAQWDHGSSFEVRLYGGALASEPEAGVLNGANVAAIGSAEAGWEVIQFRNAELVGPRTWRIDKLLRGQAATADGMESGHATGARFVLINTAVPRLALSAEEAGLSLAARCGPAGFAFDPERFVDVPAETTRRGLRCFPPVRAKARWGPGGGIDVSWLRQTRWGGDSWEGVEIPLGETNEAYRVDLLDGLTVIHSETTGAPALTLSSDLLADLFSETPSELHARIMQLSPTEGPGLVTEMTFHA